MRYSSRRVVAAWVPWVAPEDAVGPFEDSPHHSIFFYGFDGVLAAGGVEAAIGAKPWTDGSLVKPNCQDCESTEHTGLFVSSFDVCSFISSGYRSYRGMIGRLSAAVVHAAQYFWRASAKISQFRRNCTTRPFGGGPQSRMQGGVRSDGDDRYLESLASTDSAHALYHAVLRRPPQVGSGLAHSVFR